LTLRNRTLVPPRASQILPALSHQLLNAAAARIEDFEGHEVKVHG